MTAALLVIGSPTRMVRFARICTAGDKRRRDDGRPNCQLEARPDLAWRCGAPVQASPTRPDKGGRDPPNCACVQGRINLIAIRA